MGQLDLRCSKFLGKGHHSKVVLALLTIPSASSLRRAVAVKFSLPYASREMHLNEAKIYNAFPRNLQAGVAPIVPKFYGYYAPSTEVFDLDGGNGGGDDDLDKETRKAVRKVVRTDLLNTIPPILLIEACGKQVRSRYLSHTDRWARNFYKITPTVDRKDQTLDFLFF
jgi:hypothetical protein